MQAKYFKTTEDFIQRLDDSKETWLLLVSEGCEFKHEQISRLDVKCYGAIFPEVIFEKQHHSVGLVAISIATEPILIKEIQNPIDGSITLDSIKSMLVFVDGLSGYIDPFLVSLFERTDQKSVIFGGGAGRLTLQQDRVIFSPDEITQDSALIVPIEENVDIGVHHGWEFLEGPFVATSSEKNILKQINYENAFEFYIEAVERDSGIKFTNDNFFDLAKSYPLGIVPYSGDIIVRDPIAKDGDSLVLVGTMPENSVIQILKGENDKLIDAAKVAASEATKGDKQKNMTIMIDCISRVLFLEDSFVKEIDSVSEVIGETSLIGALTLGEIANKSNKYIDFYNKTCVIGRF